MNEPHWVVWRLRTFEKRMESHGKQEHRPAPSQRRYSEAQKEQAVRMVFQLRKELGTDRGTLQRVGKQLGIGTESLRAWVKQAEIDGGMRAGTTTDDAQRMKELEQE